MMLRFCDASLYVCLEGRWQTFIHHRGGTVSVFIDRVPRGNVTVLRDIPARDVQRCVSLRVSKRLPRTAPEPAERCWR